MKRLFAIVIGLGALSLLLPTHWMGPRAEFWIAVMLATATALLWLCLKVRRGN